MKRVSVSRKWDKAMEKAGQESIVLGVKDDLANFIRILKVNGCSDAKAVTHATYWLINRTSILLSNKGIYWPFALLKEICQVPLSRVKHENRVLNTVAKGLLKQMEETENGRT